MISILKYINIKTILKSIMAVLLVSVGVYAFTVPSGTITQTPATTFFADSTMPDQGAATSQGNKSIKDFVDSNGATKKATIYLAHKGAGNTTTYTVSTDETIPDNINIMAENGAKLSPDVGITLAIGRFSAGSYETFIGAGTVTVSKYPQDQAWWGNAQRFETTDLTVDTYTVSGFIKTLIDDADAATARATLGAPSAAGLGTGDSPTFVTTKLSGLTDDYIPYHVNDATGLANSPIFTDGTDVGIGTASPNVPLEVRKDNQSGVGGALVIGNYKAGDGTAADLIFSHTTTYAPRTRIRSERTGGANYPLLTFRIGTNSDPPAAMAITHDSNVGIGVTDPDTLLELYKVGTQLKLSGGAADYATFAVAADGALTITTVDVDAAEGDICLMPDGNVGIGTVTPGKDIVSTYDYDSTVKLAQIDGVNVRLILRASIGPGVDFIHTAAGVDSKWMQLRSQGGITYFQSVSDAIAIIHPDILVMDHVTGNVGINEVAPDSKLEVNGTFHATGAATLDTSLDIAGTTVVSGILDEDNMASNSPTSLASQQSIKAYADAIASGLEIKTPVTLATVAALSAYTAAGHEATKTLTADANGVEAIDGVNVVLNDRLLIKNEASADDGIYKCTQEGTGAAKFIFSRATDADTDAEVNEGMYCFVLTGDTLAGTAWVQTNDPEVDVATPLFVQFSSVAGHAMSTHSDEDTYNILTSGTLGAGNATLGTLTFGGTLVTASAAEINTPLDGASVTLTEFQELETIGATTISAPQWGHLGNSNVFNVVHYGAVPGGVAADNVTAINAAVTACPAGGIVYFPANASTYNIDDEITLNQWVTIRGDGIGSVIEQTGVGKKVFIITSSFGIIENMKLKGRQNAAYAVAEDIIWAHGTNNNPAAPTYLSNIHIRNCWINTGGDHAIKLDYVREFSVINNQIEDCCHAGVMMISCRRGQVNDNLIKNIDPGTAGMAYGIAATKSDGALTAYPRSKRITIANNIVRDIPVWEGIDTHGGEEIIIIGNEIYNTHIGITVTRAKDAVPAEEFAPIKCKVIGNTMDSAVTGTALYGIDFLGAYHTGTVQEYGTGIIANNVIKGYGDEDADESGGTGYTGGIFARVTAGLVISGNTIHYPSKAGVWLDFKNVRFNVSGNTIIDPWTDTAANKASGVKVDGTTAGNTGYIGGNTISTLDKGGVANVLDYAIFVEDDATNQIVVGVNDDRGAGTYLQDPGGRAVCFLDDPNGTSIAKADRGYFTDYIYAEGGVHVGGTSDPGVDNLLVDGDIIGSGYLDISENAAGYAGYFDNDGNNADRNGIRIQCGLDDGSGTNQFFRAYDGDNDETGRLSTVAGVFQLVNISSSKIKQKIKDSELRGLDTIMAVKVRDFEFKKIPDVAQTGFIAEELIEVMPSVVSKPEDGLLGVSRGAMVPTLVKAIQELTERVRLLEAAN